MKDNRPTRVVFIDQAKEEFELLNKTIGDQVAKGIKNSDEIRLLIANRKSNSVNYT